jgi:hypothetical protein
MVFADKYLDQNELNGLKKFHLTILSLEVYKKI